MEDNSKKPAVKTKPVNKSTTSKPKTVKSTAKPATAQVNKPVATAPAPSKAETPSVVVTPTATSKPDVVVTPKAPAEPRGSQPAAPAKKRCGFWCRLFKRKHSK